MTTKETTTEAIVWDSSEDSGLDPAAATPEELELFDTWTEEAEEAAIELAAKEVNVPCIILEGRILAGRFPDGQVIKAPMTFTVGDLEAVTAEHDNEVDMLKALLHRLGNKRTALALEQKDLISVLVFAGKYFECVQKVSQASMGKYFS